MHPVLIAFIVLVVFTAGVYIGVSGLLTNYGVDTSGSNAGAVACSPATPSVAVGGRAIFSFSGLPGGVVYHWASDEGRSELTATGTLAVTYASRGTKEVSLFWLDGSRWRRISCSVSVQ